MSHAYGRLSESSDAEQTDIEMRRVEGESEAESDASTIDEAPVQALVDKTATDQRSLAVHACEGSRCLFDWMHAQVTWGVARVSEREVKPLFRFAAVVLFLLVLALVHIESRITQLELQQTAAQAALREDLRTSANTTELAALQQKLQAMSAALDTLVAANNATLTDVSRDSALNSARIVALSEAVEAQHVESEANRKLAAANSATLAAVFRDSARHGTQIAALQGVVWELSSKTTVKGCQLVSTGFSGWVNDWDELVNFKCGQDSVISGVYSTHDNYHEDRKFRFQCSTLVCY
eukprot:Rhum_TRINITY_DN14754_c0_g2::Rhum_TRINITY_DN14754_c0_g2_i1::g.113141::m.113141